VRVLALRLPRVPVTHVQLANRNTRKQQSVGGEWRFGSKEAVLVRGSQPAYSKRDARQVETRRHSEREAPHPKRTARDPESTGFNSPRARKKWFKAHLRVGEARVRSALCDVREARSGALMRSRTEQNANEHDSEISKLLGTAARPRTRINDAETRRASGRHHSGTENQASATEARRSKASGQLTSRTGVGQLMNTFAEKMMNLPAHTMSMSKEA
jgi:hypothetical protein